MREGVAGLLREKTRKPSKAPLSAATVNRVVELTLQEPLGETILSGRKLAFSYINREGLRCRHTDIAKRLPHPLTGCGVFGLLQ